MWNAKVIRVKQGMAWSLLGKHGIPAQQGRERQWLAGHECRVDNVGVDASSKRIQLGASGLVGVGVDIVDWRELDVVVCAPFRHRLVFVCVSLHMRDISAPC